MVRSIWGVVQKGVIVPESPLPEGRRVEIVLGEEEQPVPPALSEEMEAWERASSNALERVERLAQESTENEKR